MLTPSSALGSGGDHAMEPNLGLGFRVSRSRHPTLDAKLRSLGFRSVRIHGLGFRGLGLRGLKTITLTIEI